MEAETKVEVTVAAVEVPVASILEASLATSSVETPMANMLAVVQTRETHSLLAESVTCLAT